MDWIQRFPKALVEHVDVTKSDHKCLWMDCNPPENARTKQRPFRFEESWIAEDGCEEIIKKAWEYSQPGTRMFKVWHKLKECKKELGAWSRTSLGSIKKQIEGLKH